MSLDENDYLTYQLYTASKSPTVRRARIRSWITFTFSFACLAFLLYSNNNTALGIYFLILTILSLGLFPFYTRWNYKRHYRKHILEIYKNRFGEESKLHFDKDVIVCQDKTGESKINKSEIEEVNEIDDYIFIKMRTGASLIIPKKKTDNLKDIMIDLQVVIQSQGLKHNLELGWKWK